MNKEAGGGVGRREGRRVGIAEEEEECGKRKQLTGRRRKEKIINNKLWNRRLKKHSLFLKNWRTILTFLGMSVLAI